MSRIGLALLALALGLFSATSTWPEDEKPDEPAPPLEFPHESLIARADGTVLYFYRPNFSTPEELVRELRETLGPKDLNLRLIPRRDRLVLDGPPEAVELVLDVLAYLDIAAPQVFVEAKIVRKKHWHEEAPDDEDGDDGDEADDKDEDEGDEDDDPDEIERRGQVETVATPSVMVTAGGSAEITLGAMRPVLTIQSANQGGANRISSTTRTTTDLRVKALHIGESFTTLEIMVGLIDVEPNSPLMSADQAEMSKDHRVKTTVTVADGETVVISGIGERRHLEDEGDPVPPPTSPGLAPVTRGREEARSEDEIVVLLTARILRGSRGIVLPPDSEGEDDAGAQKDD